MVGGILICGIIMAASGGVNAGFAFGLLFAVLGAVGGLLVDGGMSGSVENAREIQNYERESGGGPVEALEDLDNEAEGTAEAAAGTEANLGSGSGRNEQQDRKIMTDGGLVQDDEKIAELSKDIEGKLEEIEELAEENELELERMKKIFAELPDENQLNFETFMGYLENGNFKAAKRFLNSELEGEEKVEEKELQALKESTRQLAKMLELEEEVKEEMKEQIEILRKERSGEGELNEEISRLEQHVERFEVVEENQAKIEKIQESFLES